MAYTDIFQIATQDGVEHQRVTVAVAFVAQDVFAESDQVADHAKRLTWAVKAISDPRAMARKMIWAVASDNAVVSSWPNTSDAQFKAAVNARAADFSPV